MFDISFGEMIVIGVVALVVIGPERLPKVARTVGHLVGRAQRYVNQVKADVSREMELDELRKVQSEITQAAQQLETQIHNQAQLAKTELDHIGQELAQPLASVEQFSQDLRDDVLGHHASQQHDPTPDLFHSEPVVETPVQVTQLSHEESEFRSRQLDLFAEALEPEPARPSIQRS